MAEVTLTIAGNDPPYQISIKAVGDPTERCTDFDYASRKAAYNPVRNGQLTTYNVVVSKAGCNAGMTTFQLTCGTPSTPTPSFAVNLEQPVCSNGTPGNARAVITNIQNADRYKILRNGGFVNGGDCNSPDGTWTGSSAEIALSPPPSGESWTYVIRAYNGGNCGQWYDQSVTVTSPNCQTTPVTNGPSFTLGVTQPSCNNGTLSNAVLNLTAISNADRYNIWMGSSYQGSNDCAAPAQTFGGNWVDVPVAAPAAGQSQAYTIRIWNGNNCGQWLDKTVTVTSPSCTTQPINPSFDLSVDQPVCNNGALSNAMLHLTNVSNGDRFRTSQGTTYQASADCSNPEGTISGNWVDIAKTAPASGQTQYWTVRLWNGNDCGKWFDRTVSITSPDCQAGSVNPSFDLSVDQPTCSNGVLSNAVLHLKNIQNANVYGYSEGGSYSGSTNCAALTPFGGSWVDFPVTAPPAGQSKQYTFRVYNSPDCGKWYDRTVTVTSPSCETSQPPSEPPIQQCAAGLTITARYSAVDGPCGHTHFCNAAAWMMKANGVDIGVVNLNNARYGQASQAYYTEYPYKDTGSLPGKQSSDPHGRRSDLSISSDQARSIAAASPDGTIELSLSCLVPANRDLGYGVGRCHTDTNWVTITRNGQTLYDGCPANNFLKFNPCTGQIY